MNLQCHSEESSLLINKLIITGKLTSNQLFLPSRTDQGVYVSSLSSDMSLPSCCISCHIQKFGNKMFSYEWLLLIISKVISNQSFHDWVKVKMPRFVTKGQMYLIFGGLHQMPSRNINWTNQTLWGSDRRNIERKSWKELYMYIYNNAVHCSHLHTLGLWFY